MTAFGSVALDTSVAIPLMEGEVGLLANLGQADEVFVPAVVLGELFYGASKSGRPAENTARVARFASAVSVLPSDAHVAREYGLIKAELRRKGRPLPENDIWIAAAPRYHKLTLITRDRHFLDVDDLSTAEW